MSTPRVRRTGIALAVIGAVLLANGSWYFPIMIANPGAALSEYGGEWPYVTFHTVQLVALVALAIVLPGLRGVVGRTGRRLPAWLMIALQILAIGQVATSYANAFVVPFLAAVAPASLDVTEIGAFAMSMLTIWSGWALLVVALAVIGGVRRVIPPVAVGLLAVGALGTPMLGPGGWALLGAGLLVWALTRMLRSNADADAEPAAADRPESARDLSGDAIPA